MLQTVFQCDVTTQLHEQNKTQSLSYFYYMSLRYLILIHEYNLLFYFTEGNTTTVFGETRLLLHPLVFVGFSTVFLASLFGNSVIIHIITTDNSTRTTTNYLIINQACADLLILFAEITGVFLLQFNRQCMDRRNFGFNFLQDFYSDPIHITQFLSLDPRNHRP